MTLEIENGPNAAGVWPGTGLAKSEAAGDGHLPFYSLLLAASERGLPAERPAAATRLDAVLQRRAENSAAYERHVARGSAMLESMPLHENIGHALGKLRGVFADAGMPIIDMVKFDRTASGEFRISGWGQGEAVSHPQGKFIEDVLNGRAPGFESLTKEANAIIDKIEGWHARIQDIDEKAAALFGEPFVRQDSIFDESLIMGVEHIASGEGRARALSTRRPAEYAAFRDSLGAELSKLTERQVLSRFYYKTEMVPDLAPRFEDYA